MPAAEDDEAGGMEGRLRPGDALPGSKYIVDRALGAGGHGVVYVVRNRDLPKRRLVAKVLNASLHRRADLVMRMVREARVLADIEHPNVVAVMDAGMTDEPTPRPYFIMEYLEGLSLGEVLRRARRGVALESVLRIGAELCDALECAHTKHKIVHRDVKPENVFLKKQEDGGFVTKLLDFGIGHVLAGERELETGPVFIGTPRYAAPEQLTGKTPSPQVDLYALGLVLYECLCGRGPFDDAVSIEDICAAQLRRMPAPPSRYAETVPKELDGLVLRLLAKKADQRPASAAVVSKELQALATQYPASREPITETRLDDLLVSLGDHEPTVADDALHVALDQTVRASADTTMKGVELASATPAFPDTSPSDEKVDDAVVHRNAVTRTVERPEFPADGEALAPGTKVGRYVVRALVGTGGMGAVYSAHDPELARDVAIKLLKTRGSASSAEKLADRMRREAQAMAKLSHPNVIAVHDVGTHEGHVFVAMDLVDGGTLRSWLRAAPRTTAEILAVFEQAGRGLAAAHAAGLVHRDFKPDNVLVGSDGSVRVTDFGLARPMGDGERGASGDADAASAGGGEERTELTEAGIVVGTPAYMAPEQMAGERADARADVFAFAVSLWEALYGERPFAGASLAELRASIESGSPRPPTGRARRTVPRRVRAALHMALQADPSRRAPEMASLLGALAPRTRGRIVLGAVVAATLVAGVLAVALAFRPHFETPSHLYAEGHARPSVAVLGIVPDGAQPEDPTLGTALAEVIRHDLEEGGRGFRVVAGDRVARALADYHVAAAWPLAIDAMDRLRVQLDADYLVLGTIAVDRRSSGGEVKAEVRLVDTMKHAAVGVYRDHASEDRLVDLGLGFGEAMRRRVRAAPLSETEAAGVRARLPRDIVAQRAYAQALLEQGSLHYREARPLLERVIELDPKFVFAHAKLSQVLASTGFSAKARDEAQTAWTLSDGIPRDERLRLEAEVRTTSHEWVRALEIARALYTFYPDDLDYGLLVGDIQLQAGSAKDALETTDVLHRLPPPRGDDPRIDFLEGSAAIVTSDSARAMAAAEHARAIGEARRDRLTLANAMATLAFILSDRGDDDAALQQATDAARLANEAGDPLREASALNVEGLVLDDLGRWGEAQVALERALMLEREIGAENTIQMTLNALGTVASHRDDLRAARSFFEQARDQADLVGYRHSLAIAESELALAIYSLGNPSEAVKRYDEALLVWEETGDASGTAEAHGWHADTAYAASPGSAAEQELREAIDAFRTLGSEGDAASLSVVLARMLNGDGRAREAVEIALSAERELDGGSDRAGAARAHAEAARSLLAVGKTQDAAAEARSARLKLPPRAPALIRGDTLIAAARVLGQIGTAEEQATARRDLDDVIARARNSGRIPHELSARLARAEIEAATGHAAVARGLAASLVSDADARGFVTISRAARRLLR